MRRQRLSTVLSPTSSTTCSRSSIRFQQQLIVAVDDPLRSALNDASTAPLPLTSALKEMKARMFDPRTVREVIPTAVDLNPLKFYSLIDLAKSASSQDELEALDKLIQDMHVLCEQADHGLENLSQINNSLLSEVRNTTRRKHNPFKTDQEAADDFTDLRHTVSGHTFMHVIFNVATAIQLAFHELKAAAEAVRPGKFLVIGKRLAEVPESIEQLQAFSVQFEMNRATLNRFTQGVLNAEKVKTLVISVGRRVVDFLDEYYAALLHRHTVDGIKIHRDPVTTDIAISIYENVDSSGEITDGKKPDEVSAYSIRKATIVADAIKRGLVGEFIRTPARLLEYIKTNLLILWTTAEQLATLTAPTADKVRSLLGSDAKKPRLLDDDEFQRALLFLEDLNPQNITYKDKTGLLTSEERFEIEFRNETIAQVTRRLHDPSCTTQELIERILRRKHELHVYYQDVNSFYVCKIGNGNPFTGAAPGQLTVVPGIKPIVDINDVVGSGFDHVKTFIEQVRKSAKWHNLFLATSPSRSADKANALLIGPQGCHRKGQKVLMFDGTLLSVEQVHIGDLLMGPDSTPRQVLKLHNGVEDMVEITPTKGEPWVVNKRHMLTLMRTQFNGGSGYRTANEVKDVVLLEYLAWSKTQKHNHVLFRVGVEFDDAPTLPLEPYFVGLLLGDGCLRDRLSIASIDHEVIEEVRSQAQNFGLTVSVEDSNRSAASYHLVGARGRLNPITAILRELGLFGCDSGTKFVPHIYKTASREDRLKLLAGLMDTDGSLHGGCFDYVSKSRRLADDVAFTARSVGLAAYISPCRKESQNGTAGNYFRVMISGYTNQIPVRVLRKQPQERQQVKDVLHTGFTTKELPPEEYFGFTLDGDHRYLLDDFTVTHNCGKSEVLRAVGGDKKSVGIYAQPSDFLTCWKGEAEKNPKRLFEEALRIQKESKKQVFILIDEIDTILNDDHARGAFGSTNLTTEFQQLMDGILQYPHIAVWAATNHPERIPMPMIRRFSKVAIVGELDQADRVKLLKHFVGFLPIAEDFSEQAWTEAAEKLEGAVGDTIRKVADHVWREKMTWLVDNHPEQAEKLISSLDEGEQFQLSRFDGARRAVLHGKIRVHMSVQPRDVLESVDLHLNNIAIRSEIETARETYERSKMFLAGINARTNRLAMKDIDTERT
jgi:hypothetical protein